MLKKSILKTEVILQYVTKIDSFLAICTDNLMIMLIQSNPYVPDI